METIKRPSIAAEVYDSTFEFVRVLESRDTNSVFSGRTLSSRKPGNSSWRGTSSLEEANELFRKGWDKGCEDLYFNLNARNKSKQIVTDFDEVGYSVCLPLLFAGDPFCYFNQVSIPTRTRVITINYERGNNGDVSGETIKEASVKLLAVVNALEKEGNRVTLNVLDGGAVSGQVLVCKIKIKEHSEKLNLLTVAYPLCHTAFARRHIFAWTETCPLVTMKAWAKGYGEALNSYYGSLKRERDALVEAGIIRDDEVFVTTRLLQQTTEEEFVEMILKQHNKTGE